MDKLHIQKIQQLYKVYDASSFQTQKILLEGIQESVFATEFMLYKEYKEHCYIILDASFEERLKPNGDFEQWKEFGFPVFYVQFLGDEWEDDMVIHLDELPNFDLSHVEKSFADADLIAFKYYYDRVVPQEE